MATDGPSTDAAMNALATVAVERLVAMRDLAADPDAIARADAALAQARTAFDDSLHQPSEFGSVVRHAQLSAVEAEILAVAVVLAQDQRLQQLLAHAHADRDRSRLEVGTLADLLGPHVDGRAAVGPASALRTSALIELGPAITWSRQTVAPAAALLWGLAGATGTDPDLPLGYEHFQVTGQIADPVRSVLVTGTDRVRRRTTAMRHTANDRFLVGPAPTDDPGWAALVREATLFGAAVVVEVDGDLSTTGRRWIGGARHLNWALSSRRAISLDHLPHGEWREVQADDQPPTDDEWVAALGTAERRHLLSPQQLESVSRTLPVVGGDVDAAVRRLVSSRLEELARRIRPSRGWDDLILPPGHLRQLHELIDRYHLAERVYGDWAFPAVPSRGLVALFSGPSGTGKTLAAEVIARELGLDLFKLNLSSVVSKFIGETEKNLDELFEAAGAGNMVLFFDEADALFGRRSEVKDAHDKYANMETSYLLQRLETYDGVVVMATNFEKNIDDAFLRRIHSRVDFSLPSESERAAIWRRHLEHGAPMDDIDFDELARRFDLSGGSIRNAAVHAAFLAAALDSAITMPLVVRGMAREYRKLGRLLKREDFGDYFELVSSDLMRD